MEAATLLLRVFLRVVAFSGDLVKKKKKKGFQCWCALSAIRFHTTCTVIGFLLVLKTTCVGGTAGDYTAGGKKMHQQLVLPLNNL